MTNLEKALAKLRADLKWRGPTGREPRYVVLDREHAMALLEALEQVVAAQ